MSELAYAVTGGTGRLGREIEKLLPCTIFNRANLDVTAISGSQPPVAFERFRALIHLAAITQPSAADRDPLEAYRVNVQGSRSIAAAAARANTKIFYLSTDYVFNGRRGDYREDDPLSPANWYGCTKAAGECEIRSSGADFCVIRTSFRPSHWGFPTAFTNVYTSADYVDVIAAEIAKAITLNVSGIIHIGTPVKTFFELARRRNPDVVPEECRDDGFPKRRNLNIDRWIKLSTETGS